MFLGNYNSVVFILFFITAIFAVIVKYYSTVIVCKCTIQKGDIDNILGVVFLLLSCMLFFCYASLIVDLKLKMC